MAGTAADRMTSTVGVAEEDLLRADLYNLLGVLLARPPKLELLDQVERLEGDETPLGRAVDALARLAKRTTEQAAEREFNALFIGLGRGELLPYASYYMTGFLNEGVPNPLSVLSAASFLDLGLEVDLRQSEPYEPPTELALRTQGTDLAGREILLRPLGGVDVRDGSVHPIAPAGTDR